MIFVNHEKEEFFITRDVLASLVTLICLEEWDWDDEFSQMDVIEIPKQLEDYTNVEVVLHKRLSPGRIVEKDPRKNKQLLKMIINITRKQNFVLQGSPNPVLASTLREVYNWKGYDEYSMAICLGTEDGSYPRFENSDLIRPDKYFPTT